MKNLNRTLSLLLAVVLMLSCVPTVALAETTPELPHASITTVSNEDLTFAMNFKVDMPTEEQIAYYGDWYADFELTVNKQVTFNADGEGDGWLSGQYDEWSENWVNVPFKPVTLEAGQTLKIMAFAAEMMNQPGLKLTYLDVCSSVQDFNCGVYFTDEFLAANPDLEVKLELKMYNPANENESYVVGDTYVFDTAAPKLPTAKVSEITNDDLTFAMNFRVNSATKEQLAYYGNWYADFELTINKKVSFDAEGTADGWLSGQYDEWSYDWVNVPFGKNAPVIIEAGETVKIMAFAAKLMDKPGLKYTFKEVYETVKDFNCGVYFDDQFLTANPDLEVKLELKMYNPANEAESYVIGETYTYVNPIVAKNTTTGKVYDSVSEALLDCADGQTVVLLKNVDELVVYTLENTTLDLNGNTLKAEYISCFGDIVDNSAENTGLLVVDSNKFMIREDNAQLPIRTENGYLFAEVVKFNARYDATKSAFGFQPFIEAGMMEVLKNSGDATGVTIQVQVTWKQNDGYRSQNFVYNEDLVNYFLNSYNPSTNEYKETFTLTLSGAENFTDLTFTAMVVSEQNVKFSS